MCFVLTVSDFLRTSKRSHSGNKTTQFLFEKRNKRIGDGEGDKIAQKTQSASGVLIMFSKGNYFCLKLSLIRKWNQIQTDQNTIFFPILSTNFRKVAAWKELENSTQTSLELLLVAYLIFLFKKSTFQHPYNWKFVTCFVFILYIS